MEEELNLGSLDLDSDEEGGKDNDFQYNELVSPWTKPLNELKAEMTELNPYLWKRVTRKGKTSVPTVPPNARVDIRYNGFWEGESAPFDSSILRGRTFRFVTGHGEVLEGLEAAVCTMHPGECSQFVISYHLLFHELGCPPRIKPKADGLFIIELLSYNVVGNLNADLEVSKEDRRKYSIIKDKVMDIHLKGLDFFKQSMYHNAIQAFEKALNMLKFSLLANEEEATEQTKFLMRIYTNLMVSYNKVNKPNRACIMYRELRQLVPSEQDLPCKVLFQDGRAKLMLGDFNAARHQLVKALRLSPNNHEINQELKLLDEAYGKYRKDEKSLWKKAFGVIREANGDEQSRGNGECLTPVEQQIKKVVDDFIADQNRSKMCLPPGLTNQEINTIKALAKEMNLKFFTDPLDRNVHTLRKRLPQ